MKRQLSLLATLALTDVLKRLHKALLLARNCLEHEDLGEKETWVSIKARFILKVVVAGAGRRVSSTHQHFFQGGRLLLAHTELPANRIPM